MANLTGLRALVLGGSGLIGSHVVRALLARGGTVRVLSRNPQRVPALRGLDVEVVEGSLERPESIRAALAGVDILFHAAAPYPSRHFGMSSMILRAEAEMESLLAICREMVPPELLAFRPRHAEQVAIEQAEMAAHVLRVQPERSGEIRESLRDPSLLDLAERGMLNASLHPTLDECRALPGLKRVIYTSSVTTIGMPRGREPGLDLARPARESDRYDLAPDPSPYFALKRILEAAVTRAANEGLPAVILNPTLVIDEGDAHETTGRLFLPILRRRMPFYTPGTVNAIAGRDVGEGHVLAALCGRTGQRYILAHEEMSLHALMAMIAAEAGVPAPWLPVPRAIVEPLSLATELVAQMTGAEWAAIPAHGIRMVRYTPRVDGSLAARELGLARSPLRDAVRRAVTWYRSEGMV
jgi:nucleoside-diphosphate-sugar epimerase